MAALVGDECVVPSCAHAHTGGRVRRASGRPSDAHDRGREGAVRSQVGIPMNPQTTWSTDARDRTYNIDRKVGPRLSICGTLKRPTNEWRPRL